MPGYAGFGGGGRRRAPAPRARARARAPPPPKPVYLSSRGEMPDARKKRALEDEAERQARRAEAAAGGAPEGAAGGGGAPEGAGAGAPSPLVASVIAHTLAAEAEGTIPEDALADALESVPLADKARVARAAARALPRPRTAALARRLAADALAAAQRSGRTPRGELEDAVAEAVPLAAAAGVLAAGVASLEAEEQA